MKESKAGLSVRTVEVICTRIGCLVTMHKLKQRKRFTHAHQWNATIQLSDSCCQNTTII